MRGRVRCLWVLAVVWVLNSFAGKAVAWWAIQEESRPAPRFRTPVLIEFSGIIDESTQRFFRSRLAKAQAMGADLIILEIDSPGGLKTVSLDIAETLRDVDWAQTVAFVPRTAISGGALVALGCDEIIADPKMKFGDIGEIYADPEFFAFRFVPAKIQSVLVRQARDLAEAKGRPPDLAEAMIDKDALVFARRSDDGRKWEFQVVRVDDPRPPPPWELIPETGPERFLTVNGSRAVELGIAEGSATSREELAQRYGLTANTFVVMRYGFTDGMVDWLVNPWITFLLVVLGVLALYLELSAPGIGVGAVVAGLCAALFFWSRFLGGTADWLEVILFLGGLAFLAMEMFVIPGWGLAGIMGIVCLASSFVMAGQDFFWPANQYEWHKLVTSLLVLAGSGFAVVLGAVFIAKWVGNIPLLNQMVLEPKIDSGDPHAAGKSDEASSKASAPQASLVAVGDIGLAVTVLRPAGRARFASRSFDVVSDGEFVDPGKRVRIIRIQGNVISVMAIDEDRTEYTPVS